MFEISQLTDRKSTGGTDRSSSCLAVIAHSVDFAHFRGARELHSLLKESGAKPAGGLGKNADFVLITFELEEYPSSCPSPASRLPDKSRTGRARPIGRRLRAVATQTHFPRSG